MKGTLIVLEGIDGSGKETRLLASGNENYSTLMVTMPCFPTDYGIADGMPTQSARYFS